MPLGAALCLAVLAPDAAAQTAADSGTVAALDSLRTELVRSRGFLRGAETQLTKTLAILDSLRARLAARDSVAPPPSDSVAPPPPDSAPAPENPAPPPATDSIIAWSVTTDPATRDTTLYEGDTLRVRIVAAGVTAITPDGQRVQRAATWAEIAAAGFTWIHSGLGARRNPAPDGTAITFVATQASAQWPTTHLSAMWRDRVVARYVITIVARPDTAPSAPAEPDPVEEPEDPPTLPPTDTTPAPPRTDSVGYLPELGSAYRCARLVAGDTATVVGDTIRVTLTANASTVTRSWCIPYNWPAVSAGDPFRARTYPAEPNATEPYYAPAPATLPARGEPEASATAGDGAA